MINKFEPPAVSPDDEISEGTKAENSEDPGQMKMLPEERQEMERKRRSDQLGEDAKKYKQNERKEEKNMRIPVVHGHRPENTNTSQE